MQGAGRCDAPSDCSLSDHDHDEMRRRRRVLRREFTDVLRIEKGGVAHIFASHNKPLAVSNHQVGPIWGCVPLCGGGGVTCVTISRFAIP